jgi:alkylhydroperoxidase/carboxymuconolactone decarboxylase family protein YurZ
VGDNVDGVAIYCGWPKAMSAMSVAKHVFAADGK